MNEQKTRTDKPTWLLKLEQESWQAELIISGVAIFGSLQLPELIDHIGEWALIYFSTDLGNFCYLFLMFLYLVAGSLIFAFIIHFIFRAIWIGFIGLNSIFPEGIKNEGGIYSKIFMEKIRVKYNQKNFGIEALDKLCSGIFGFCTFIVLISLTYIVSILIFYSLYALLSKFLSTESIELIAKGLFTLISILAILTMVFTHKRFAENERIQHALYIFSTVGSLLFFHIFSRPLNYLSFLFSTNIELKKYLFYTSIILFFLFSFVFYKLRRSSNIFLEDQIAFHKHFAKENAVSPEIYEEHLTENSPPIYSATIPSKLIEGQMMSVFIPIFPNEKNVYSTFCGAYVPIETLSRAENKEAEKQYYINCYQAYHRIYINNQLQDLELVKFIHPHRSSEGVTTYIPTVDFIKGKKNMLKVEKLLSADSVYRTMIVPFWFGGE